MKNSEYYSVSLISCIFAIIKHLTLANATATATATDELIPRACKKFAEWHPDFHGAYDVCVKAIGSDSRSSKAKTMVDLAYISLDVDIPKAMSIASTADELLKDPKYDDDAKFCSQYCSKLHSEAQDFQTYSNYYINIGQYSAESSAAGGARGNSEVCDDSFKEPLL